VKFDANGTTNNCARSQPQPSRPYARNRGETPRFAESTHRASSGRSQSVEC
jgi:hypothetical protein